MIDENSDQKHFILNPKFFWRQNDMIDYGLPYYDHHHYHLQHCFMNYFFDSYEHHNRNISL